MRLPAATLSPLGPRGLGGPQCGRRVRVLGEVARLARVSRGAPPEQREAEEARLGIELRLPARPAILKEQRTLRAYGKAIHRKEAWRAALQLAHRRRTDGDRRVPQLLVGQRLARGGRTEHARGRRAPSGGRGERRCFLFGLFWPRKDGHGDVVGRGGRVRVVHLPVHLHVVPPSQQ